MEIRHRAGQNGDAGAKNRRRRIGRDRNLRGVFRGPASLFFAGSGPAWDARIRAATDEFLRQARWPVLAGGGFADSGRIRGSREPRRRIYSEAKAVSRLLFPRSE